MHRLIALRLMAMAVAHGRGAWLCRGWHEQVPQIQIWSASRLGPPPGTCEEGERHILELAHGRLGSGCEVQQSRGILVHEEQL